MRVVCSYCRADLGTKEPLEDFGVTHGMCQTCYDDFERKCDAPRLGEYLDQFPIPVFAVDPDGRILSANQRMADLLGKPNRELMGLLGGEVMDCAYASLPEGCGRTEYCPACTIRRVVMKTITTGEPQQSVPAYVQRYRQRLKFLISTQKHGEIVMVTIDEMTRVEGWTDES